MKEPLQKELKEIDGDRYLFIGVSIWGNKCYLSLPTNHFNHGYLRVEKSPSYDSYYHNTLDMTLVDELLLKGGIKESVLKHSDNILLYTLIDNLYTVIGAYGYYSDIESSYLASEDLPSQRNITKAMADRAKRISEDIFVKDILGIHKEIIKLLKP